MKNLYDYIVDMPVDQWHYYSGVNGNVEIPKPFVDSNVNCSEFILNYFKQGGKVEIFESCQIDPSNLRLPNHICSVFFLGVLLYNNTYFHEKYKLENNAPGYASFPFIWFLIALFHDNAYQMEIENKFKNANSIQDVLTIFDIQYSLLSKKFSKCKQLLKCRINYFTFRRKKWNLIDHGILGGLLLFDRLVKIRRKKKKANEDKLFWGRELEKQYETAANAISIHNIWLQSPEICSQYNLNELKDFKAVKFKEFPLFYILGIIDTIEPLKIYKDTNISDIDILKSISIIFDSNKLKFVNNENSKINFIKLTEETEYFKNWLDVSVKIDETSFELTFH